MKELKIIDERELFNKPFRIYGSVEEPLFLAKEVAEWIEHSNPRMMLHPVDDEEKQCVNNPYALKGQQEQWFLTENGLYEVLMQSRKPIAKQFKKKVKEILKDIRKHGMYATDELLNNPDLLIKVATALKEEKERNKALTTENRRMKPKEIFADAVTGSGHSILIGELAKILKQNGIDIGEKRLFEWMRNNGYLIKRRGTDYNMPTQKSMELGLFEIKETVIVHSTGLATVSKTTKVSGKGQQYFINKFLQAKEIIVG